MKQSLLFIRCVRLILLLACLPVAVQAVSAVALDTSWNDNLGDWFDDSKWTAGIPYWETDAYVDKRQSSYYPSVSLTGSSAAAEAKNVYLGYTGGSLSNPYIGLLEVTDDAGLTCQSLTLGYSTYSYGYAHISGNGSTVLSTMSGGVSIGEYGEGVVFVEDHGYLESLGGGISLGDEFVPTGVGLPASKGTLDIASGGSVVTPGIYVGHGGQGCLYISGGGSLNSSSGATIGHGSRSDGSEATVTDANSVWNSGSITVGYQGSATLMVESGGRVNASNLYIGSDDYASGSVTVSDSSSRLDLSGNIMIYRGSLTINNGLVEADSLDMHTTGWAKLYDGTLDVEGLDAINGSMYLYGGTLRTSRYWAGSWMLENNGATLDPKDYLLKILRDASHPGEYRRYKQSSGSLWIDVDGSPASGLFDQVIACQANFDGGSLELDFTYVPAAGTTYQFLDVGGPYIAGSCPVHTHGLPTGYWVEVDFPAGTFTVMPEPSALLLLLSGVAALLAFALRRRR